MGKITIAALLLLTVFSFAGNCYFQTRRMSYDSETSTKKISCRTLENAIQDIRFYNSNNLDNYARYYEEHFGQEGNLIAEEDGYITINKFYYALGEYRYYGSIMYYGANVYRCITTTSTGYCDQLEYNDFAMYLRDFLSSSARKRSRR
jgi:hypothetical protein